MFHPYNIDKEVSDREKCERIAEFTRNTKNQRKGMKTADRYSDIALKEGDRTENYGDGVLVHKQLCCKGNGKTKLEDMPTDIQRYADLCHDNIIDWGNNIAKGNSWYIAYFRYKPYVNWVLGVGRSRTGEDGLPMRREDCSERVSYMGEDLWNFYQYILRMRKLEYDHMSHFTGKGRSERRTVCISPEEHLRYLDLENRCEALQDQVRIMKSKEEEKSSDGENLHEKDHVATSQSRN